MDLEDLGLVINMLKVRRGKIHIRFHMVVKGGICVCGDGDGNDESECGCVTGMVSVPEVLQRAVDSRHIAQYITDELEEYAVRLAAGTPYSMAVICRTSDGKVVPLESILFRPQTSVMLETVLCL